MIRCSWKSLVTHQTLIEVEYGVMSHNVIGSISL